MLGNFIYSLEGLRRPKDTYVDVLIIDNDFNQSAKKVIQHQQMHSSFKIHYDIQPIRGIAAARNKVLETAIELKADYVAFVDDDEVVQPLWLCQLYDRHLTTNADAVGGPVYLFPTSESKLDPQTLSPPTDLPELFLKGKKGLRTPYTNNVLISSRVYKDLKMRFDESFGLSGGEDVEFFNRASRLGVKFAFSDHAYVIEYVPSSRMTEQWRFMRQMNIANSNARIFIKQYGYFSAWLYFLPRMLPRVLYAFYLLSAKGIKQKRGRKHFASSIGVFKALVGFYSTEYKNIHGS